MIQANLLIVDDDAITLDLHTLKLQQLTDQVYTAASGSEAVAILRHEHIDVLVTDYYMPDMDGCELITQAVTIDPMIQSIVVTGYVDIKIAIDVMGAGAFHYLQKPIDFEELEVIIARCLEKRRLLQEIQTNRQQLEKYQKHLEGMVEARTRALKETNQKLSQEIEERTYLERSLRKAKAFAEYTSKAKSEFLANMSHEIRTPMNGIMGMAQLLESTEPTANQKKYIEIIKTSADGLMTLINDLLDLAKIESGKLELDQVNFSLRGSINEVLKAQIVGVQNKGLSCRIDIANEVPDNLVGDQHRLQQILLNLVSNAIKFTDQGGIHIAVTESKRQGEIVHLEFVVTDSGTGIYPQSLQKIFEPFVQEDASITRQYGGTGLGLTICNRLTQLMGGIIWGESIVGTGSSFFFQVPFVLNEAAADPLNKSDRNQENACWDGPLLRILNVDDKENNLVFVTDVLQRVGHTVIEARDGQEAVQKYEQHDFDVILMDVQMPVLGGIDATRIIRDKEKATARHIVIIAVTARVLCAEREKILRQGFDGYVGKPIEITALFNEIKTCLPGSAVRTCLDNESPLAAAAIDREQLSTLLTEMELLLQNHDLDVLDKVTEFMHVIRNTTPAIDTLRNHIRQFDYASALASLRGIDNEFKIRN